MKESGVKIVGINAKESKLRKGAGFVAMQGAYAVVGFMFSRISVFSGMAPFGISASAAMPVEYSLATAVGCSLGYVFLLQSGEGLRYIAAVLLLALLKKILSDVVQFSNTSGFAGISGFAACLLTASAMFFQRDLTMAAAAVYFVESLLAGGAAYFIHNTSTIIAKKRNFASFDLRQQTSVIITLSIALMALTPFKVAGVSVARTAAVIVILASAKYGKESAGAVAGIAAGMAMSFTGQGMVYLVGGYAFGGLMAGVFSAMGNLPACLAFMLANGIVSLSSSNSIAVIIGIYEVMIAVTLFLIMPKIFGIKLSKFFSPVKDSALTDYSRQNASVKLDFASGALKEVCESLEMVADKLKKVKAPQREIVQKARVEVCRTCGIKDNCWETSAELTGKSLTDMANKLIETSKLEPDDMPEGLKENCVRKANMVYNLKQIYEQQKHRQSARRRVEEMRGVITDQFLGMSELLDDIAADMQTAEKIDNQAAEKIELALDNMELTDSDVICTIDRFDHMKIEIRIQNASKHKIKRLAIMHEASIICGREFDPPCVSELGNEVRITLCEQTSLAARFGVSQYAPGGAMLCGDAYEFYNDGKGKAVMILSDGMGNGGRAAVDGAMACGLMARLLKAGFSATGALKIVNSAMLFKSEDESLATLDIATIDLFSGRCDFFKAGAAPTLLKRGEKVGIVDAQSLPAGILREVEFQRTAVTMGHRDVIVMMSDGVFGAEEWLMEELADFERATPQEIADHIIKRAQKMRKGEKEDDITVLTAVIERN